MDYLNQEFYRLNKGTNDLVYNFANEKIIYRKEKNDNGNLQIVEIRQVSGETTLLKRVVSSDEMSVEDFDYWKKKLTDEALEYQNKDARETRRNVNLDRLVETALLYTQFTENSYLREDLREQDLVPKIELAMKMYACLTSVQRRRFYKAMVLEMSTYEIAKEEGVSNVSVYESIVAAEKKLRKERNKAKNF